MQNKTRVLGVSPDPIKDENFASANGCPIGGLIVEINEVSL